jgi:hypothetical protein
MQDKVKTLNQYVGLGLKVGFVLSLIATLFVAWAVWKPMESLVASITSPPPHPAVVSGLEPLDVDAIASSAAGRRLVRPGLAVAAVKDNGTAAKLLAHLKLQGTITDGDRPSAYILVDKNDMRTVYVGDQILEFRIEEIGGNYVRLVLDGVSVALKY